MLIHLTLIEHLPHALRLHASHTAARYDAAMLHTGTPLRLCGRTGVGLSVYSI